MRYLHKNITVKLIIPLILGIIIMNFCYAQETQSPSKGYLDIGLNVSTDIIYVVVNDDWENYKSINMGEPLELPAGRQKITVIVKGFQDATFYADILPGKTIKKNLTIAFVYIDGTGSSYQWIKNGINYFIITDDDSEIFIDGKWIALGSFEIFIPLGKHKIETVHPSGTKKEKELNINSYTFRKIEMYNKPVKWKSMLLSLTPGGSQLYKNQNIKGYSFTGLTVSGLALAGLYYTKYQDSKYVWIGEEKENDEKIESDNLRYFFLYSAIGIYSCNIFDALFLTPQAGYRGDINEQYSMSKARLLGLIPGASQLYKKQDMKSNIFTGLIYSSAVLAMGYEGLYISSKKRYKKFLKHYQEASLEDYAFYWGEKTHEEYKLSKQSAKVRDIFMYSAIGLYAINVLDAIFSKPSVKYQSKKNGTAVSIGINADQNKLAFCYKITF